MIVHAEDGRPDRRACARRRGATPASWPRRPRAAEERRDRAWSSSTARRTGGRAHVVHLSAADAVPALRAARAAGVDVTRRDLPALPAPSTPSTIADGATELKCCPPIREAANRDALWAGARPPATSTSSSPTTRRAPPTSSAQDAATSATPGAASPRSSSGLPVVWTGARERGVPARRRGALDGHRARPTGSGWPARAGSRVGADADLCVFAPDEEFVVDVARAAPQEPGLGLRRAYAHRHRARDLAARRTGRPVAARRGADC